MYENKPLGTFILNLPLQLHYFRKALKGPLLRMLHFRKANEVLKAQSIHLLVKIWVCPHLAPIMVQLLSECGFFGVTSTDPLNVTL